MPQGAPNFSWRIKKPDHQRNSIGGSDGKKRPPQQPRMARPFFKPRSLKTTGSCHWILCSTRRKRKCSQIDGDAAFPALSFRHKLNSVKVSTRAKMASKTDSATVFYEAAAQALPLVKTDSRIKAAEDSNDSLLTSTTSPEADDDPDEKANGGDGGGSLAQ